MEKVLEFLKKNNVCTVATSSGDMPRASVIDYYVIGNAIIFATDPNSIKANNLQKNNHISMSVQNMPQFVTLDGSVTEPTQSEIEGYMNQLLINHPEFKEMMGTDMMQPFAFYKLVIDTAYWNDLSNGMVPTEIIKGNVQ